MLFFFVTPKFCYKHCLQFLLAIKMAPRETENNAYAKFGVTNKEHHGMLWYFLEWSRIQQIHNIVQISISFGRGKDFGLRILADPSFECHFTEVIFPNNIWWLSRSPPPPHPHAFIFQANLSGSPSKSFQSYQRSSLLGSQLRLIPPFVLSKIKWSPLKPSTPPQVINNWGLVLKNLPHPSSFFNGSVPWLPIRSAKIVREKPDCLGISTWPFRFRAMYFGHVSNI